MIILHDKPGQMGNRRWPQVHHIALDAQPFSPIVALDRFLDGRVFKHINPSESDPPSP